MFIYRSLAFTEYKHQPVRAQLTTSFFRLPHTFKQVPLQTCRVVSLPGDKICPCWLVLQEFLSRMK